MPGHQTPTGFLATDAVRRHYCARCQAAPGQPCRRPDGRIYSDVHAVRTGQAARCPDCGPAARRPGVDQRQRARLVLRWVAQLRHYGPGYRGRDMEEGLKAAEALAKDVLA